MTGDEDEGATGCVNPTRITNNAQIISKQAAKTASNFLMDDANGGNASAASVVCVFEGVITVEVAVTKLREPEVLDPPKTEKSKSNC